MYFRLFSIIIMITEKLPETNNKKQISSMAILNPQLLNRVLVETEGLVLVDEIDLHLHPTWQKRILTDLMEIFPKVQFVVSTHAPEVINSVASDSVIILKNNESI